MKLSGHTMATPEMRVEESLRFFADLGLDGAEIIVQNGYLNAVPEDAENREIEKLRRLMDMLGLETSCVTPYLNRYNDLDESVRAHDEAGLKRVIEMAAILNAASIRVYGGAFKDDETDPDGKKMRQLVKTLRNCGDYADRVGVNLSIENHFGTMATTVAKTMTVIRAIDHPRVGVLYDQANLAFFPAEGYEEAIDTQIAHINHVHVKDLVYRGDKPGVFRSDAVSHISEELRTVFSRIPGDGILDWPAILQRLKNRGYDGWLSLEYERRWGKTDLPIATEGLPVATSRMRKWLSELK